MSWLDELGPESLLEIVQQNTPTVKPSHIKVALCHAMVKEQPVTLIGHGDGLVSSTDDDTFVVSGKAFDISDIKVVLGNSIIYLKELA